MPSDQIILYTFVCLRALVRMEWHIKFLPSDQIICTRLSA